MPFELISDFQPTGDQPEAIRQLTEGLKQGSKAQVFLERGLAGQYLATAVVADTGA